ncbi:MAG: autotransporter assembly complex protein TamA [Deltaproteobacteria bacterium]|nr:autotransporter assembly complex protein TamA [Deltaproteobacteria bacterium]
MAALVSPRFKLAQFARFSLLALFLFSLCACGQEDPLAWNLLARNGQEDFSQPSPLVSGDPDGPVAAPEIPDELKAAARDYQLETTEGVNNSGADKKNGTAEKTAAEWRYTVQAVSPEAPELATAFMAVSQLEELKDNPPDTLTGLNQRIQNDLEECRAVLNSFGYYEGRVWSRVIQGSGEHSRNIVQINFRPGRQYTLGRSRVTIADPDPRASGLPVYLPDSEAEAAAITSAQSGDSEAETRLFRRERSQRGDAIKTLGDVGLPEGSPAVADDVLNAVDRVAETMRNRGYPFAEVLASRFVVDHEKLVLEAEVTVQAGPYCYMGPMEIRGENRVSEKYLEAIRNWKVGERWNQRRLENFSNSLRQTGLFQLVNVKPAETTDENGLRTVVLELAPAPERTVSGALKYNSDFGAGVQAGWTHRNFTGRGDRLTVEMPIWQDMQILFAEYRLPFLPDKDQDFVAQAAARNEDVDAYKLSSVSGAMGLERRFSRNLTGSAHVSAEGGTLETPDEPKTEYYMLGLPGSLSYNRSNSLLDATDGFKLTLLASPYSGYYNNYFTVLRTRLDAAVYLPLVSDSGENRGARNRGDKLVLALRGSFGSVFGADSGEIPATIRFYSGGGGSVRGYAYQSLGPRNGSRDPLGGASMTEVSAETRWKAGEDWGLVAFLDGGMVYDQSSPDFGQDLQWGAGLGFRYYTAIGPVRLDVATPLNPRNDDDSYQLYISIGQSF